MAIARRQKASIYFGAESTTAPQLDINFGTPILKDSTVLLIIAYKREVNTTQTVQPVSGQGPVYTQIGSWGETLLDNGSGAGVGAFHLVVWSVKMPVGSQQLLINVPGAPTNAKGVALAYEYTGMALVTLKDASAYEHSITQTPHVLLASPTRAPNELWLTCVAGARSILQLLNPTNGNVQIDRMWPDGNQGVTLWTFEKEAPTQGSTNEFSATSFIAPSGSPNVLYIPLMLSFIPSVIEDAVPTSAAEPDANVVTAIPYQWTTAISAPEPDANSVTRVIYKNVLATVLAALGPYVVPIRRRAMGATSAPAFGLGSVVPDVLGPHIFLTAVSPSVIDGSPGSEITLTGTFPINTDIRVTIGDTRAISGVSGRPLLCRTQRADQLTAYLPDIKPGLYDVTVSIGSDSTLEDAYLSQALLVEPPQKRTSVIAFRKSFSKLWKVGDRQ